MKNVFDVCIIGSGIAGTFCTHKLATQYKEMKVLVIELGSAPSKRRSQMNAFMGLLSNSDGKLYLNDLSKVSELVGNRKTKTAYNYSLKTLSNVGDFEITKDRSPILSLEKKFKKLNYDLLLNDFIQTYPKDAHMLSKYTANVIDQNKNITSSFDNEVQSIIKSKKIFTINTERQAYKAKKVIVAVGRSGWRFARDIYSSFGIIENNDISKLGIKIEINSNYMKDFNKSNCSLFKGDEIELGPLSWYGTVIPEDHTDLRDNIDVAISAFRSNEGRWKSDKVSFNLIGNRINPNKGFEETDRLSKLSFVLSNDRILKERVSYLLNDKSKISILPEFNWLKKEILELSTIIPELLTKAHFHIPTIIPLAPKINIGNDLSTEINGLYVAGESCGITGILTAMTTGSIVADSVSK
jgi:hypothetical protein